MLLMYAIAYFDAVSLKNASTRLKILCIIDTRYIRKEWIKFEQEIDLIHYVKSLRLLKTLIYSLMDDKQRHLSIYQHQNWLKLFDWDLCKENTKITDHVAPKLICKVSQIKDHDTAIKKFFDKYLKQQLNDKDYRLLKGVYWGENLTDDELEKIMFDKYRSCESEINSLHLVEPARYVNATLCSEQFNNQ